MEKVVNTKTRPSNPRSCGFCGQRVSFPCSSPSESRNCSRLREQSYVDSAYELAGIANNQEHPFRKEASYCFMSAIKHAVEEQQTLMAFYITLYNTFVKGIVSFRGRNMTEEEWQISANSEGF